MTTTVRVVVDVRAKAKRKKEAVVETMSMGELLYWVMFGDGRVEAVGA